MKAVLCGVCLLWAANVAAQPQPDSEGPRFQGGLGFLAAAPVGDFGDHVDSAMGILLQFDVGLARSIFSLGVEFASMGYGDESRHVYVGDLVPDIPGLTLKVNTDNEMFLLHARVRAQRRTGRWRPYADGLIGFTNPVTTTSIEGVLSCSGIAGSPGAVVCSSTTAAEATNAEDYVLSYGGTAGVTIGFRSSPAWSPRLDLSVRYHRGEEAGYLTEGAIDRDGNRAILHVSRSATDMVMAYIGVAFGR